MTLNLKDKILNDMVRAASALGQAQERKKALDKEIARCEAELSDAKAEYAKVSAPEEK